MNPLSDGFVDVAAIAEHQQRLLDSAPHRVAPTPCPRRARSAGQRRHARPGLHGIWRQALAVVGRAVCRGAYT